MTVGGHTHTQENLNADGLPYSFTRDGSEPGILTLEFDGAERSERYTVRNESEDQQLLLGVNSPAWREWAQQAQDGQDADKTGEEPAAMSERVVTRSDLRQGETWLTSSFLAEPAHIRQRRSDQLSPVADRDPVGPEPRHSQHRGDRHGPLRP